MSSILPMSMPQRRAKASRDRVRIARVRQERKHTDYNDWFASSFGAQGPIPHGQEISTGRK